jgi:uncharacterized membrane protein
MPDDNQPEPLRASQLRRYSAADVSASLKGHRYWRQTQMGVWVAGAILLALLIAVGLLAYLAADRRQAAYITSVGESLQPFILPTLGALVGYSLRAQQERTDG